MPSSLAGVRSDALGFSPLPTGGGLRYGHLCPSPRGFSWRHGMSGVSLAVARDSSPPQPDAGDLPPALRPTEADTPCPFGMLRLAFPVPPWFTGDSGGAGILTGCPVACALRPRLRTRLTLRRLTFRRNPWAFGAPGFHRGWRYSFRDSHSPTLHQAFPPSFSARGTLPYRSGANTGARGFGGGLSPGTSSARVSSTGELLRTL